MSCQLAFEMIVSGYVAYSYGRNTHSKSSQCLFYFSFNLASHYLVLWLLFLLIFKHVHAQTLKWRGKQTEPIPWWWRGNSDKKLNPLRSFPKCVHCTSAPVRDWRMSKVISSRNFWLQNQTMIHLKVSTDVKSPTRIQEIKHLEAIDLKSDIRLTMWNVLLNY